MEVYLLRQYIASIFFMPDLGVKNTLYSREVTNVREVDEEKGEAWEEVQ